MSVLLDRRTLLRGSFGGAAVAVALPVLDGFLNANGTALAATGKPLPQAFGTWFQALSFTPGRWLPDQVGKDYESGVELKPLDRFKDRINLFSGMKYFHDSRPMEDHRSGWVIGSSGGLPVGSVAPPSIDAIIADHIGQGTRFRSLEVSLSGTRASISRRANSPTYNPSEPSPAALYRRVFGPEFKDPNAATFTPDAMALARRSVLSVVAEDRKAFTARLGAADRARMDEYFTAVRQIENQLEIELAKPAPLEACSKPGRFDETELGNTTELVEPNTKLFGQLLAHALSCDQTRVVNVHLGIHSAIRKTGGALAWHSLTHEEPTDEKLGYQPQVAWFINWANHNFASFLSILESTREGPGNLLDRLALLWITDHGDARIHSVDNVPIITVGSAGGRLKSGYHLSAPGDPSTRVGLTLQQAFGVPVNSWGLLSNATTKTFTEIMA
ncbi:MAG: DUF1552 domain-containing protein [Rhodospirillaceae bacterium]|nr:DUF1552 domain-containing protein [Rhodospirillaceae bacterium]